jgi:hypothetical protein
MAAKSIVKVSELEGARRLDAEYYQPLFQKWAKEIERIGYFQIHQIGKVAYGSTPAGGVFEETGVPFIRSQNFTFLSVDVPSLVFCSPSFHKLNMKSAAKSGDILLATVGATIGEIAIVPEI